jgi:hypothetical protein
MQLTDMLWKAAARALHGAIQLAIVAALIATLSNPVEAAFVGDYSFDKFTLLNTNADGFWSTPDGDETLMVTGGNNGTGFIGSTYFLMFAPTSSLISFDYLFESLDEWPELDQGGYFKGGAFHTLSPLAIQGAASFAVSQGEGFGFGVRTDDNWGGPASITISNFQVAPLQAVPEPALGLPILIAGAACAIWRRRHSSRGAASRGYES